MIFMLVKLLNLAKKNWKELGSEAIHVVSAKLTRRLRKFALLGQTDCLQPSWRQYIQISITEAHEIVKQHWESLVAHQGNIKITAIATLKPELDLDMKLVGLDDFLVRISSRKCRHLQIPLSSSRCTVVINSQWT
ncbi:hypothetical protein TUN205_06369 [Pyrenophora tritici-repentis]|nr:hypothetical protein TUN205_06369 [Pyrenophora tritici-repentis]